MLDSFDEKHKMVKKLLDMLRSHAVNEVESGLKHPEGEGDMHGIQAERVEVLPDHKMDHPTPEHDVVTHEMHKGGVVEDMSDGDYPAAPTRPIPYESANGHPDKEGSAHEEVMESEEEREAEGDIKPVAHGDYPDEQAEPSSMFASFLGRKKRK